MAAAIFPGCLVAYRFPEYEKSARLVLEALGIEPRFVSEFTCCGSQVAESEDEVFLLALGARNLAMAQARGVDTLICLCGSCTYELLRARDRMKNPFNAARINEMLAREGLAYSPENAPRVRHILEVLSSGQEGALLRERCVHDIPLRLALQEPCNAVRPARLHPELGEDPSLLREITALTGAEIVDFPYEKRCCGGTMLAFDESVGMELASLRYKALEATGAHGMITACPNCQSVYAVYPVVVDKRYGRRDSRLPPPVFITQVLGLSMGLDFHDLGLGRHRDRKKLLELLG